MSKEIKIPKRGCERCFFFGCTMNYQEDYCYLYGKTTDYVNPNWESSYRKKPEFCKAISVEIKESEL